MNRRLLLACTASFSLVLSAPAQKKIRGLGGDDPGALAPGDPAAVLVIDGEPVSPEAYALWLIEEVGPPFAHEFAGGWLVEKTARERGLGVGEEEIRSEVERLIGIRIEGAFNGEKEGWLDELRRTGRSEGGLRRQFQTEQGMILHATALAADGRVVPESKILRDWELFHGPRGRSFVLDMMKFQVVVQLEADFKSREDYERAREKGRALGLDRARRARERLLAGEDFAALARELSDDEATRASGGRVERFSQFGWPDVFQDALFELEKGEVSEPVFARGGWWIVRAVDWTDTPLESVRADLERRLIERGPEQDEVGGAWNAITQDMQVEILPELYSPMSSVEVEGQRVPAMLVNGEPVPRATYARWLLHTRGEASWRQFTEEWLVERKARELGIEVAPEEIDARTEETIDQLIAQSHKGDRGLWAEYLRRTGRDEEIYTRQTRRRQRVVLLVEKLMLAERVVTEEMVRARYERMFGATGRRVQARVLALEIKKPALEAGLEKEEVVARMEAAREARLQDALALVERARSGEDFAALVERYSDEPLTRERGGRLEGGFDPEAFSSVVTPVVMAMDRGEISEPMLEGRNWLVFEVTDFEEVSYESVKDELRAGLQSARPPISDVAAYRNVLLKESEVDVLQGMYR